MAAVGAAAVQGGQLLFHASSGASLTETRTQVGAQRHVSRCHGAACHVARDGAVLLFPLAPIRGGQAAHLPRRGGAGSSFAVGSELKPPRSATSSASLPRGSCVSVRAVTESKGLGEEGGKWLSSTTRHVRLYIGYIDPETQVMDQSQLDKISLRLDPDDEFIWPEAEVQKVYNYFQELVDRYEGADMTEYTLRLMGSDIEHFIRKLLLAGEIKYNLNCRVLNYSMGKPRLDPTAIDVGQAEFLL